MDSGLIRLPFFGNSMKPLLKSGDDVLYIENKTVLQVGEIVLFKDPLNGEFVIHRVMTNNPLTTKGDWSCHNENISSDDIFGTIKGYVRSNKIYLLNQNKTLLKFWMFLTGALLLNSSLVRKIARVVLLMTKPFMQYESTK